MDKLTEKRKKTLQRRDQRARKKAEGGAEVERIEHKKAAVKERKRKEEANRQAAIIKQAQNKEKKRQKRKASQREQNSRKKLVDAELQQVELLLDHESQSSLETIWKHVPPGSELSELVLLAKFILQEGAPATCIGPQKTYTLVNMEEFRVLCQSVPVHGIVVLRDTVWHQYRQGITSEQFIESLPDHTAVDVQDLGKSRKTVTMTAATVKRRWQRKDQPPINLLNIRCDNMEVTPPVLLEEYDLLRRATEAVDHEDSKEMLGKVEEESYRVLTKLKSNGGEDEFEVKFIVDLKSCQRFQICGQAGAISGWHMDSSAPYTWVTLEPNRDGKPVLKYWAVVDFDNQDKARLLQEFAAQGSMWHPPKESIRIISLTAGDTLIMPPGTIHAPITVTNCLFRGGMCWSRKTFAAETLPQWEFIASNNKTVTNEDPARQTAAILAWIESQINLNPASFQVSLHDIQGVRDRCTRITNMSLKCDCSILCKVREVEQSEGHSKGKGKRQGQSKKQVTKKGYTNKSFMECTCQKAGAICGTSCTCVCQAR